MAKAQRIIKDYLTGEEIDVADKPEEEVRQEYLRRLHEEYRYPKEHLGKEVSIQVGSEEDWGRADIVVYKTAEQRYDDIYIVVECKAKTRKDGEKQAKSYANNTTASIAVWHNGIDPTCYWLRKREPHRFEEKLYLPAYGQFYGDKRIVKEDLRPAANLKASFQRIHDNIYANVASSNKAKVFSQMLNLIFTKMYDEKSYEPECKFVIHDREAVEIREKGSSKSFETRILGLFDAVKDSPEFRGVFEGDERIALPPAQIAYVVSELENITILNTDVKGEAYQAFISAYFRGEAGQFFTPDPIKELVVEMLDPRPDEIALDPACGSGGFLVFAINHYRDIVKGSKGWVDSGGQPLPDLQLSPDQKAILKAEVKLIARDHIKGMDFDADLTKVAKMYMVMVDDGHTGIHTVNSLVPLPKIEMITHGDIRKGCAHVIMTNPPFGSKGRVGNREILSQFDLGYKWRKDPDTGEFCTEKVESNLVGGRKRGGGQVPDILFIERCIELLRPGGRMAIVLPDGDLQNQNTEYLRAWLQNKVQIVGTISLPPHTFVPFGAGVKPSILFLKKPVNSPPTRYPIFFGVCKAIGYDVRGRKLFKRNEKGEVINREGEVIEQAPHVIEKEGAVDSDIPQILQSWNKFRSQFQKYLW